MHPTRPTRKSVPAPPATAGPGPGLRPGAAADAAPSARRAARALRRLTVSTVAVLPQERDLLRLRETGGFPFAGHDAYLGQLARHLHRLARGGGEVRAALFDPLEYAGYCERTGLDPGRSASRGRYSGEVAAAGVTVRYHGQPVRVLLDELLDAHDRRVTWELCSALLAAAGDCPECGAPLAGCAFRRAGRSVAEIVDRAGPGSHRLVCSLLTEDGPLTATARFPDRPADASADGPGAPEPDALLLRTVLAAALAVGEGGGLVLRSVPPPAPPPGAAPGEVPQEVRGWGISGGRLRPLTEAEVFMACCTEPGTGEPVPPEPGVRHRAATELPSFRCRPR